ncbi:MAG: TylF/MycF/NovP-related O-methyltransferase [Acidimicrobiia bacterium]|nr:TylF/MycF/NovP-related O-methyltransferase [Acidimicrobiia bacterium]
MKQPRQTVTSALRDTITDRRRKPGTRLVRFVRHAYPVATLPLTVWFLFLDREIHPAYGMTWPRLFLLAYRLYRNTTRIITGTSYRAHLLMLAKLLETPPEVEGVVVECGSFKGGSTANLSLICDAVGRDLVVYDSFEGLPAGDENDKIALPRAVGVFRGLLAEVRENVERYGVPERCEFRKGWYSETIPTHDEPIVLCFLDVDLQMSIHQCLVGLWPWLTERGYLFTDDFPILDLCAVFYSEEFWRRSSTRDPPGLIGTGTGAAMGQYWVGPFTKMGGNPAYPLQTPASVAYTRKDFSGHWGYRPPGTD